MTISPNQQAHLREQASRALQRGDGKAALAALAQISDAPPLSIAQAHMMAGDFPGAERILDNVLTVEPRNFWALLFKGDCRLQEGDNRAATNFFITAQSIGQQAGQQASEAQRRALAHIGERLAQLSARFDDDLRASIAKAGFDGKGVSPRIEEALDLLSGRRQIYLQQPRSFYFPGLPQIQFYEREQFDWIPELEAKTEAIREELIAVLSGDNQFAPYVESEPGRLDAEDEMVGDERWSAYYLWKDGAPVGEHAAQCPKTMEALASVPMPHNAGKLPMALFSLLRPGMHIPPHTGVFNTRLICHLPLITPPGCSLRVGNEERAWERGKTLIFDDSIEHEARNDSKETRVVLLFDIWRPEISEAEREVLAAMFDFIFERTR